MKIRTRLIVVALVLSAGAAGAQSMQYFSHPSASPLTGAEVVGPVRQNGRDVSVTVTALLGPAFARSITSASVNAQNHLVLVTQAGTTIDAGQMPTSFNFTPALNLSMARNSGYLSLF
jgi:hypothetical protein